MDIFHNRYDDCTVFHRTNIGWFDERLLGGQDLDWLLTIARRTSLATVAAPSMLFRIWPYGTYDALQPRRPNFNRRLFFRILLESGEFGVHGGSG
jgi:hypothetical protein